MQVGQRHLFCMYTRSQRNVRNQQKKRYNTAADRSIDFKLGMGFVITAEKDWRGLGRPCECVECIRNCRIF